METVVPAPQSIEDVEALVKQFYQPGNPAVIAKINEELQRLQHSDDGWRLADGLLGSTEEQVRFFGALTFMVKLNSHWFVE